MEVPIHGEQREPKDSVTSSDYLPPNNIKVFISYSWDSEEHKDSVFFLAQALRLDGVDCVIDQFVQSPDNWQRWMLDQIEESDYVLIICTERYYKRYRGQEEVNKGLGVTWESTLIMGELYEAQGRNTKFVPVFFSNPNLRFIPDGIRNSWHDFSDCKPYNLLTIDDHLNYPSAYESLYRLLTNQPSIIPTRLGRLRKLEPIIHQYRNTAYPDAEQQKMRDACHTKELNNDQVRKQCPYQGLNAFSEVTKEFFFGRSDGVTTVLNHLNNSNFCIVSGNSGVGKSSLLAAGVIPALKRDGWTVLRTIRPGSDPLSEIKSVLIDFLRSLGNKSLLKLRLQSEEDIERILKAIIASLSSARIMLVIDQFEELFTLSSDQKTHAFFAAILSQLLGHRSGKIGIIFSIRTDFLSYTSEDAVLSQFFRDPNIIFIMPMSGNALREAIVRPASKLAWDVEDKLVSELVSESKQPGSLPLLQFTLTRLWDLGNVDSRSLTFEMYTTLGGLSEILNGYADKVMNYRDYRSESPTDFRSNLEVECIKQIFIKLVRPGRHLNQDYDTRQRLSIAQLKDVKPFELPNHVFDDLIEDLIESRLVVSGGQPGNEAWIDLAHESLTSGWIAYAQWLKQDRDVRRLAERIHDDFVEWNGQGKSNEYLLSGGLLRNAISQKARLLPYLGKELEAYLENSDRENIKGLGFVAEARKIKSAGGQPESRLMASISDSDSSLLADETRIPLSIEKYTIASRNIRLPTPGCYADPDRAGPEAFAVFDGMTEHLFYTLGKLAPMASRHDLYMALSYAVRDRLMIRLLAGNEAICDTPVKVVAYFCTEYLIGPQLSNNLLMLGIQQEAAEALQKFGINNIEEILEVEDEPGLGNGELGRLAACFLESMASLEIPATGYGIRYEFGYFDQLIRDGWQVEITDKWLKAGWPWEIPHPDQACFVAFGGHTESYRDERGAYRVRWIPAEIAIGVPHDVPVLGFRVNTCNRLRLWRADAAEAFDFYAHNIGDYYGAVEEKVASENITKLIAPNDNSLEGRRLRLMQQHFFVSCSVQDMIRSLEMRGLPIQDFHDHWGIQLNDTHPVIAVAELMRLLLDERNFDWETSWNITTRSFSYTNHTLLTEALEKWGLDLFGSLLPRHLELIYEINRRFLQQVRLRYPGDKQILRQVSIIDEDGSKAVRMAQLAIIASHHVNGVSTLHSEHIKSDFFPEFATLWPEKFLSITNGVTPRRWMALANPQLAALLTEAVGEGWLTDLDQLRRLEPLAEDTGFLERWQFTKWAKKRELTNYIHSHTGVLVDPSSLFDVQVTRIHEYKRQHLNALQVVAQYLRIKNGKTDGIVPRTVIFGGKAAPDYAMAKLIIRFINGIAETVNVDPAMDGLLRVVFLPDYNVKVGERVYPAADLSEQISTVGKEASGTGKMKFAMNGALTIGTMDGASVEICEQVGEENFFAFGHSASELHKLSNDAYDPLALISSQSELKEALLLIEQGHFSNGDQDLFSPLVEKLKRTDPFFIIADFAEYLRAQEEVCNAWSDPYRWSRSSLLNTARIGFFSSDRAIRQYARTIWRAERFPVAITCEID